MSDREEALNELKLLKDQKDKVTEDCDDKEWSLWGTGCVYAGNKCLVRKGKHIDHEAAWDDAVYFIIAAANFMDEHEATIRAALSEPEWQPISTAPRDGTPVLVYAPYGGGFITQSYWKAMPNNGHMWVVDCGEICPTHWMPLPSPPKGKTP